MKNLSLSIQAHSCFIALSHLKTKNKFSYNLFRNAIIVFALIFSTQTFAQIDTAAAPEEEDYSQYENVTDAGEIKLYSNPKIFDLSPNRFISLGYDFISKARLTTSPPGSYNENDDNIPNQQNFNPITHGLRINSNIPVISKTTLLWQIGGGYIHSNYADNDGLRADDTSEQALFYNALKKDGLHSTNLNTTIYRPLSEKSFVIVQLMGELSGNYSLKDKAREPDFSTIRSSVSALYGKRPHDRFQWAIGVSKTYRAGELNYVPIVMYNYTSLNRKWGTEILFPARAAYRRKFNPRSILLAGYELEGTSYRLYNTGMRAKNIELRRSELRIRLDYQRQLKGFVWIAFQAGLRYDISYNVDTLPDNKEFFRGFFGIQKYHMLNQIGAVPYCNISINLVSP